MLSGIRLANSRGHILQIGDIRLRIGGERRPCERMNGAVPGLRVTMQAYGGGGAFAEVLDDGPIEVGDRVRWTDPPPDPPSSQV
jgi:MOSC domain-containing protein YiiM